MVPHINYSGYLPPLLDDDYVPSQAMEVNSGDSNRITKIASDCLAEDFLQLHRELVSQSIAKRNGLCFPKNQSKRRQKFTERLVPETLKRKAEEHASFSSKRTSNHSPIYHLIESLKHFKINDIIACEQLKELYMLLRELNILCTDACIILQDPEGAADIQTRTYPEGSAYFATLERMKFATDPQSIRKILDKQLNKKTERQLLIAAEVCLEKEDFNYCLFLLRRIPLSIEAENILIRLGVKVLKRHVSNVTADADTYEMLYRTSQMSDNKNLKLLFEVLCHFNSQRSTLALRSSTLSPDVKEEIHRVIVSHQEKLKNRAGPFEFLPLKTLYRVYNLLLKTQHPADRIGFQSTSDDILATILPEELKRGMETLVNIDPTTAYALEASLSTRYSDMLSIIIIDNLQKKHQDGTIDQLDWDKTNLFTYSISDHTAKVSKELAQFIMRRKSCLEVLKVIGSHTQWNAETVMPPSQNLFEIICRSVIPCLLITDGEAASSLLDHLSPAHQHPKMSRFIIQIFYYLHTLQVVSNTPHLLERNKFLTSYRKHNPQTDFRIMHRLAELCACSGSFDYGFEILETLPPEKKELLKQQFAARFAPLMIVYNKRNEALALANTIIDQTTRVATLRLMGQLQILIDGFDSSHVIYSALGRLTQQPPKKIKEMQAEDGFAIATHLQNDLQSSKAFLGIMGEKVQQTARTDLVRSYLSRQDFLKAIDLTESFYHPPLKASGTEQEKVREDSILPSEYYSYVDAIVRGLISTAIRQAQCDAKSEFCAAAPDDCLVSKLTDETQDPFDGVPKPVRKSISIRTLWLQLPDTYKIMVRGRFLIAHLENRRFQKASDIIEHLCDHSVPNFLDLETNEGLPEATETDISLIDEIVSRVINPQIGYSTVPNLAIMQQFSQLPINYQNIIKEKLVFIYLNKNQFDHAKIVADSLFYGMDHETLQSIDSHHLEIVNTQKMHYERLIGDIANRLSKLAAEKRGHGQLEEANVLHTHLVSLLNELKTEWLPHRDSREMLISHYIPSTNPTQDEEDRFLVFGLTDDDE